MALRTAQVAAAATATQLAPARQNRIACILTMIGDANAFIGGSAVTTSTGALLLGTAGTQMTIPGSDAIYGIVASSTETISVLEILA